MWWKEPEKQTWIFIFISLCTTTITLYKCNLLFHHIIWTKQQQSFNRKSQPNIIDPVSLYFDHIEILDFVLYYHPEQLNKHSIFLSGRGRSWRWNAINCSFPRSNTSIPGTIDTRSPQPFVLCPLSSEEEKLLLLNETTEILLSLHIKDTILPNKTFISPVVRIPIYERARHNVSIYTMIKNKNFELIEWIEYHLMIGVEHFYLYNHLGNDSIETFLEPYLRRNLVTIIQWPYAPLEGQHWNSLQSASMNHALKTFGPFNRWMGCFDVDEYFQITALKNSSSENLTLTQLLDRHFPESTYPGGVQFQNCEISCFLTESDIIISRYTILFEKCRHIPNQTSCYDRTKLFIRPKNVPLMQNIHALEYGGVFAPHRESSSFGQFRHYHYGTVTSKSEQVGNIDISMDGYIENLKKRVIIYRQNKK